MEDNRDNQDKCVPVKKFVEELVEIITCCLIILGIVCFITFIIYSDTHPKIDKAQQLSLVYNEKDLKDFTGGEGDVAKFQILPLKEELDEQMLEKMDLSNKYIMQADKAVKEGFGSYEIKNVYCMYLKEGNGACYIEIPAEDVKIYNDAKTPCLVAWELTCDVHGSKLNKMELSNHYDIDWDEFNKINLHISKEMILPKIIYNADINKTKK